MAENGDFTPKIVAFCCYHSGLGAAEMAGFQRKKLSAGLRIVRIPCGGKLDVFYVLKAFENGADGVVIVTCPPDSCRYLRGNIRVSLRLQYLHKLLEELGIDKRRVQAFNFAFNQGYLLAEKLLSMEKLVKELGPLMPMADHKK